MASFEEFQRHQGHFLKQVELQANDNRLHPRVLSALLQPVSTSRSVGEMHEQIMHSVESLNRLKMLHRLSVKVLPGPYVDTALVEYSFQWLPRWGFGLWTSSNREGGRLRPTFILRNVRGLADQTSTVLEFKPNTRTWGVSFNHYVPSVLPATWSTVFNYHRRNKQLDVNLKVVETGESVGFVSQDEQHQITVGRSVRSNYPYIDRASFPLLQKAILTSEKYFLSHEWHTASVPSPDSAGHYLSLRNELSLSSSTRSHLIDLTCSQSFPLHSTHLTLELSAWWRWLPPWSFRKLHYNDTLRTTYIKGFQAIGTRNPPADDTLRTHFEAVGDCYGTTNVLSTEFKLHFRRTPILHQFGITPFIYGNLIGSGVNLKDIRPALRGSIGLGVDWKTRVGRVEVTYAAKVVKREGDLPAELQVLYY